jgi:hypothetical protein
MSYQQITPSNAKQILRVNNMAMTAMCREIDGGAAVSAWLIADVSRRIADAEAVLAAVEHAKRTKAA